MFKSKNVGNTNNKTNIAVLKPEPKPLLLRSGAVDLEYLDEKSIQKSFPWTVS